MTYQEIFDRMCREIWEEGREYPDAEHDAAIDLHHAGVMDYDQACDALQTDYDRT